MCDRFHFVIHAYCQMTNHFHLLIETPEGNLGQGMRQLNSAYSQHFNRRHGLVGHVMQAATTQYWYKRRAICMNWPVISC